MRRVAVVSRRCSARDLRSATTICAAVSRPAMANCSIKAGAVCANPIPRVRCSSADRAAGRLDDGDGRLVPGGERAVERVGERRAALGDLFGNRRRGAPRRPGGWRPT